MSNQRYDVKTGRKNEKTGKTFYRIIGSAWDKQTEHGPIITVQLDALPVDGKLLIARPWEDKPGAENRASVPDTRAGIDEIPF